MFGVVGGVPTARCYPLWVITLNITNIFNILNLIRLMMSFLTYISKIFSVVILIKCIINFYKTLSNEYELIKYLNYNTNLGDRFLRGNFWMYLTFHSACECRWLADSPTLCRQDKACITVRITCSRTINWVYTTFLCNA
jgi:hypothetical protein